MKPSVGPSEQSPVSMGPRQLHYHMHMPPEASPAQSYHFLSTYCVLDIVCALSHLILKQLYEVGMIRFSLWMRKLRR